MSKALNESYQHALDMIIDLFRDYQEQQERIETLEAALKCLRDYVYRSSSDQSFVNDVFAELGGLPNEREPIAALQENIDG